MNKIELPKKEITVEIPVKKKKLEPPHTSIIIFVILVFAFILTYVVPLGYYSYEEPQSDKKIVDVDSFQYALDENGKPLRMGAPIFSDYFVTDRTGFFNYLFDGMVSGGAEGTVGVIVFIVIIGGVFGIILRTGAMDEAIYSVVQKSKGKDILIVPVLFVVFSFAGVVFGFNDESIPFCMVTIPLFISLGYDAVTAIMTTFVASQIGFGTSWMNPFSVGIAQGIAGLPMLSGSGFRIVLWVIMTLIGTLYTTKYAMKIRKDPTLSISYESDEKYRRNAVADTTLPGGSERLLWGHRLVLITFGVGMGWIVYGVIKNRWYFPQMATQFFIMGLVVGVVAWIFKLENFKTINDIPIAFGKGVENFAGILVLIGMSKGIVLLLGGTDLTQPSVMNTILHGASNLLSGVPNTLAAWGMFVFQCLFNLLVSSATGQAAISMPIMAPLSDLIGVSRQISVLAFQLGDAFTDTINPIGAILLAVIGIGGISYSKWVKWQIKFAAILFICGSIAMVIAALINFS